MTPEHLDHLRRIDAHLANLLSTAEKRTPGEWAGEYEYVAQIIPNQITFGEMICEGKSYYDMDFIASCAGNAEAGWKATRAAIEFLLMVCDFHSSSPPVGVVQRTELETVESVAERILAAFPNI